MQTSSPGYIIRTGWYIPRLAAKSRGLNAGTYLQNLLSQPHTGLGPAHTWLDNGVLFILRVDADTYFCLINLTFLLKTLKKLVDRYIRNLSIMDIHSKWTSTPTERVSQWRRHFTDSVIQRDMDAKVLPWEHSWHRGDIQPHIEEGNSQGAEKGPNYFLDNGVD